MRKLKNHLLATSILVSSSIFLTSFDAFAVGGGLEEAKVVLEGQNPEQLTQEQAKLIGADSSYMTNLAQDAQYSKGSAKIRDIMQELLNPVEASSSSSSGLAAAVKNATDIVAAKEAEVEAAKTEMKTINQQLTAIMKNQEEAKILKQTKPVAGETKKKVANKAMNEKLKEKVKQEKALKLLEEEDGAGIQQTPVGDGAAGAAPSGDGAEQAASIPITTPPAPGGASSGDGVGTQQLTTGGGGEEESDEESQQSASGAGGAGPSGNVAETQPAQTVSSSEVPGGAGPSGDGVGTQPVVGGASSEDGVGTQQLTTGGGGEEESQQVVDEEIDVVSLGESAEEGGSDASVLLLVPEEEIVVSDATVADGEGAVGLESKETSEKLEIEQMRNDSSSDDHKLTADEAKKVMALEEYEASATDKDNLANTTTTSAEKIVGNTDTIDTDSQDFSDTTSHRSAAKLASNNMGTVAAGEEESHNRFGIWSSFSYGKGRDNSKDNKYKTSSQGGAIGMDYEIADDILVGISGRISKGKLNFSNSKSKNNIDSYLISLYGAGKIDQLIWEASIFGGKSKINTSTEKANKKKSIAKAKYNSVTLGTETRVGYDVAINDKLSIIPTVGFRYAHFKNSKSEEKGAGILNNIIAANTADRMVLIAGGRLVSTIEVSESFTIYPEIYGFARYRILDESSGIKVTMTATQQEIEYTDKKPIKLRFNTGIALNAVNGVFSYGVNLNLHKAKSYHAVTGTFKIKVNF